MAIEIRISEVMAHLRDSGQFQKAIEEIAARRASGEGGGEVNLVNDLRPPSELSDQELEQVAGGWFGLPADPSKWGDYIYDWIEGLRGPSSPPRSSIPGVTTPDHGTPSLLRPRDLDLKRR